ncbi:hypothetical protein F2P81_005187 [Scophthalmus maximus]|uniref:Uncharacterized protein n=1 Tax=Scophthalmus maximus TaxID=52904 RepID=A0A6A4T8X9_SCOMX|nr:hypothetical protein F2P81_005187 [Scophthalmus maximus]
MRGARLLLVWRLFVRRGGREDDLREAGRKTKPKRKRRKTCNRGENLAPWKSTLNPDVVNCPLPVRSRCNQDKTSNGKLL